jgi:sugar fermentation stimulation protein A
MNRRVSNIFNTTLEQTKEIISLNKTPQNSPLPALKQAQFLRRYKRFLADIRLPTGEEVTLHCPNTGAMTNCLAPMTPCWYSTSNNTARKYAHTLEIVTTPTGDLAGIHSARANQLVEIAIRDGVIAELQGYETLQREVVFGTQKSRVDFVLSNAQQRCFVEVKSVTLMEAQGQGLFPDAVSERGTKHLRELMQECAAGNRAVLLFCVQHTGIEWVEPARQIDPVYAATLCEAVAVGVEVLAYRTHIDPHGSHMKLTTQLPFVLTP